MSHFWKRVKLGEDSKWGKIKKVELVNPHLPFRSFSGSSISDDFVLSRCGLSFLILSFVFNPNSWKIRPGPKTSKVLKANPPLVDVPRSPSLFRASALYGRQSWVVRPFLHSKRRSKQTTIGSNPTWNKKKKIRLGLHQRQWNCADEWFKLKNGLNNLFYMQDAKEVFIPPVYVPTTLVPFSLDD